MTTSEVKPDVDYGVCDVCKENPGIGVASSGLGAFSCVWCRRCAEEGAEPYWAILATATMGELGTFKDFAPWFQDTVLATLKILDKTLDEFWLDVEKAIEEEQQFWADQQEQ
jgi:hypothetical protein